MLTVRNLAGLEEPLADVKELNVNRKVNGEKTLTLKVVPTKQNSEAFKMVEEEATLIFQDNEYVIKKINQRSSGNSYTKNVTAIHKFFTDMIDSRQRNVHNGSLTFANALKFIFEGTNYTYVIIDQFNAETFENFGGDNRLALLQTVLERYQAEMEISGTQVRFKKKIGNDTDFQFRYGHNVKTFSRDIDTSNLSTYIKGYGKKKEETDVLSGTKIPYESRSGSYSTQTGISIPAATKVGDSFKGSFTGTGFTFDAVMTFLGGIWEFTIDGSQTVKISTYKEVVQEDKTFTIIRDLENKKHTYVGTFKGADSKNWNTSKKGGNANPLAYLKTGNVIGLYRELIGDESYQAVAEYTSPNAEIFGLRDAGDVVDERFTQKDSLLAEIKSRLQDTPETSISIDFVDLRAAGYPYTVPNEGDRVYTIYEPIEGLEFENRILEIDEEYKPIDEFPYYIPIRTKVTLANYKKTFSGTMMGTVQKALKSIVDSNGKVKSSVLDDAVLAATKALQSAQTEVEFINGFLLRSKEDSNDLVVVNSAGIGLSVDGGNTFGQAMTAQGFVADYITTGTLRAIIIEGVEIYGSLIESAISLTEYTRIQGAYVESRGTFSRTWLGHTKTEDVATRLQKGYLRFRNEDENSSLYFSHFGASTYVDGEGEDGGSSGSLIWWDKTYSPSGANGITLNSHGGVVALESDLNRIVLNARQSINLESKDGPIYLRPFDSAIAGNNTFAFRLVEGEGTANDGMLYFGSEVNGYGVGLRFSKTPSFNTLWLTDGNGLRGGTTTLNSGRVHANEVRKRDGTGGVYWNGSGTGTTGGSNQDVDNTLYASGIRPRLGDSDLFLATDTGGSVRVTNYAGYNAGNGITYRPIVASEFNNASLAEYKEDIQPWDYDALSVLMHEWQAYMYRYKNQEGEFTHYSRGSVIGDGYMTPPEFINGDAVNLYEEITWSMRAIQQLGFLVKDLAQKDEEKEQRIFKLEQKLSESESA